MFWFWTCFGLYILVAFTVATAMGVASVKEAKAKGRHPLGCDCMHELFIGILWPLAVAAFLLGTAVDMFPRFCVFVSDSIDRFVAKEGKKRLEKSEPRENR